MTNITTQTGSTTEPSTTEQATNKAGVRSLRQQDRKLPTSRTTPRTRRAASRKSRDQLRQQAGQQTQRVAETMRGNIGGQLQNMASGQAPPNGMLADVTGASGVVRPSHGRQARPGRLRRGHLRCEAVCAVAGLASSSPGTGAGRLAGRLVRSMDTNAVIQAAKPGGDTGGGFGETESGTETGLGSGNGQPLAPPPISAGPPPRACHRDQELSDPDPSIRRRSSEMADIRTAGTAPKTTDPGQRGATEPIESDRSLGELVSQLSSDFGALVSTQLNWPRPRSKTRRHVLRQGCGHAHRRGAGGLPGHRAVVVRGRRGVSRRRCRPGSHSSSSVSCGPPSQAPSCSPDAISCSWSTPCPSRRSKP